MYKYEKPPYVPYELQYMRILQEITDEGVFHPDRTGTGRRSITARTMKIDLAKEFPLVTTQRVFVRGAFEELKWMLSGSTNVKDLHKKDIHFWDAWAVTEDNYTFDAMASIIDKIGIPFGYLDSSMGVIVGAKFGPNPKLLDGSIGNLYGTNWRGSNMEYFPASSKADQLKELLRGISKDRYGSRHVMTTLIPDHKSKHGLSPQENVMLGKGALFPCHGIHLQFQILPQGDGKKDILHSFVTARSQDWAVGTIINVPFYAFFTHLIAKQFDLELGEMTYVGVDCHIYENQLDSLYEQLSRRITPDKPLPQICIKQMGTPPFDAKLQCTVEWEDIEFTTPYTPMKHIPRAVSV